MHKYIVASNFLPMIFWDTFTHFEIINTGIIVSKIADSRLIYRPDNSNVIELIFIDEI